MTVLGKVAVPKPINLPNQRSENHGLDPNVEIVPKGTLSWGSRSSTASNPWGSPPDAGAGAGSPIMNSLPSSGGTGTRPSTAGSDKSHEPAPGAWGSSSQPSSASGVFVSNQTSTGTRPRSADTQPGSSQLSLFAEPVSENSGVWHSSWKRNTRMCCSRNSANCEEPALAPLYSPHRKCLSNGGFWTKLWGICDRLPGSDESTEHVSP